MIWKYAGKRCRTLIKNTVLVGYKHEIVFVGYKHEAIFMKWKWKEQVGG